MMPLYTSLIDDDFELTFSNCICMADEYRTTPKMCGIIGIFKHEGSANIEIYEGLLMLQHRGQDSAGMVTTDWERFKEYKENGLVKDVFADESVMNKMKG